MPAELLTNTVTATATNAKVVTDTATIFVMRRLRLGCGRWHAFVANRGGQVIFELPYRSLSAGRRIDDMSSASVTIDSNSLSKATPAVQEKCCGLIGDFKPWKHEIALWREGDLGTDDPTWVGPMLQPKWAMADNGDQSLTVPARDLFMWFERRLLEIEREFTSTDLADIFDQYVSDALVADPSPNITTAALPTGILGDRSVDPLAFRRAADEMRELMRSGVDGTMVGRTMVLGGVEVPTADLGTLVTEHFRSLEVTDDGLQTETQTTVVGVRAGGDVPPVFAQAGGVDPDLGLVQNVINETTIEDTASAQAAADSRYALLGTTPMYLRGVLSPEAPISFDMLIPGARADLRVTMFCREVITEARLQDVDVTVDDQGNENVTVTFSTLGTLGEV